MSNLKLSEELIWRNLIKDKTFKNLDWIDTPRTFYLGIDCGNDSLTIGNLAVYLLAKRLIMSGWKFYLLVGGATSLIGDPGGKDEERNISDRVTINKNVLAIKNQVSNLFKDKKFELVDNYDWFKNISYLDFLRDVGKNYSMTDLLQRDYIKDRIGKDSSGISYAEFSYSLIQGYDFWQLFKNHNVELQIGGSDQWGNMLSGVPLVRKKEASDVHAMSMPLVINKSTGKKFGKSEEGAIWLDSNKTPVIDFYQFWINVDDIDVIDYFKIYTFLSKERIDNISKEHDINKSKRIAQKILADEITTLVHGKLATNEAINTTSILTNHTNDSLDNIEINSIKVKVPVNVVDLLVKVKLASSKSEARRLMQSGGVYIDNISIKEEVLNSVNNNRFILRRGKALKDSVIIEINK